MYSSVVISTGSAFATVSVTSVVPGDMAFAGVAGSAASINLSAVTSVPVVSAMAASDCMGSKLGVGWNGGDTKWPVTALELLLAWLVWSLGGFVVAHTHFFFLH